MSSRVTFGTIKRVVAILIAIVIVLAAGIIVGQAPALFGVEDDPAASIEFDDQDGDGESIVIDEVSLSDGGFIVVTDGADAPIAVSDYLGSGTHENVTVERDEDADEELVGRLTATVHQDTTDDETYAYDDTDGEEDRPYLEDGFPVSDTATVTTTDDGELDDTFTVDAIDAPDSATTDETINVTAEITNPTDLEAEQNIDLRLDGVVLEQQTLDLGAGESAEISFEVETTGVAPGERTIGVFTDGDGELESIDLEFHTTPDVSVVAASDDEITADVAIPAEGFVAIEDDDGDVIGASDDIDPGEHSNVTVELDDDVDVADDEELTAVLYEGESDDRDDATALEDDDGERVESTFTIDALPDDVDEDADDGDENGDETDDEDDADD